jgi:hypothetical protein
MRKRTFLAALLAFGLFAGLLAACGSENSDNDDSLGFLNSDGGEAPAATAAAALNGLSADEYDPAKFAPAGGGNVGGAPQPAPGVATAGGETALPDASALDRQIIRTTTIELTVDDVAGAVQRIETAATAVGGYVAGSSLTVEQQPPPADPEEEQEVRQHATVTIRVPAENYAGVMSSLREIVDDPRDISSLTEDTSEVTEEYTDLQSRLRNLEATESQYLELLGQAATIGDILTVQDRLNTTRLEIEQVKGRIQLLDDLTSLATITVQVSPPPLIIELQAQAEGEESWAEEAWDNAWGTSEDVAEALGVAAITAGVLLVWLLVPGGLFLGGWWVYTSRRRASGGPA